MTNNLATTSEIDYTVLAQKTAKELVGMLGSQLGILNLDNCKRQEEKPCLEGETDMARKKFKVILPTGETVWITGNTTQEAFENGLKLYGAAPLDKLQAPTLGDFVKDTYRPSFINGLAPKTISNYEIYLKCYILPYLGDMRMNEINVATVQSWYDWMAHASERGGKKDLNQKTIERVSGLLGRIFHVAVEMKIVNDTPIKKTLLRNHGEEAGHHTAISREDMDKVKRGIPSLANERQRVYMALLAYGGMRPEEILGLRWECVYLDKGYCDIVRTVTYPGNSKAVLRECGKTKASIRIVALPDPVIDILQAVKDKQGFVLHGDDINSPMPYSTHRRAYTAAFKALGVKCSSYDYRTTYGTELAENGFTSKQVADMLGHADSRMVETVYARRRNDSIMIHRDRLNELNKAYVQA